MSIYVRSARATMRSCAVLAVVAGIVALAGCGGGPSVTSGATSGSGAGSGAGVVSGPGVTARGGIGATAASGGVGKATASPVAPTLASFADQYLAIAKVADQASAKANAGASHVFTQGDQVALFRPLIAAEVTCDNLLLKVAWPTPKITTDVQLMVAASGVLTQDQAAVGGLSAQTEAAWITRTSADATTAQQAANVVRADLGLAAGP